MRPKWEVYGLRWTHARGALSSAAVTRTFGSEEDATSYLVLEIMKYGPANVHAVIVYLKHGRDYAPEREVIRRVGGGKGWWE